MVRGLRDYMSCPVAFVVILILLLRAAVHTTPNEVTLETSKRFSGKKKIDRQNLFFCDCPVRVCAVY